MTLDGADRRQFDKPASFLGPAPAHVRGFDHGQAKHFAGTAGADGRVRAIGVAPERQRQPARERRSWCARRSTSRFANPRASDPLARFDELRRHGLATAVWTPARGRCLDPSGTSLCHPSWGRRDPHHPACARVWATDRPGCCRREPSAGVPKESGGWGTWHRPASFDSASTCRERVSRRRTVL